MSIGDRISSAIAALLTGMLRHTSLAGAVSTSYNIRCSWADPTNSPHYRYTLTSHENAWTIIAQVGGMKVDNRQIKDATGPALPQPSKSHRGCKYLDVP